MNNLYIGTGRSDITPAPGTPQGIWGAQTHERGVGADMPLYATALAVSAGSQTVLIVDVDAIGFNAEWSLKITDAVSSLTAVPPENIRISASHTHSGPKTQRLEVVSEGLDMALKYLETLPHSIAGAAWQAQNNLRPARAAAGTGSCDINVNRRLKLADGRIIVGRNWEGPVDHTVRVVRFDDLDGKPLAIIVHYACHPTIMAWDNQWFTPDYPGIVRQVVEREADGTCLFLQGATGSLGPREGFTGDRSVYRKLGTILGLEASKVAIAIETAPSCARFAGVMESGAPIALYEEDPIERPGPVLRVYSRILRLPTNQYPPVEDLDREAELMQEKLDQDGRDGTPVEIRATANLFSMGG